MSAQSSRADLIMLALREEILRRSGAAEDDEPHLLDDLIGFSTGQAAAIAAETLPVVERGELAVLRLTYPPGPEDHGPLEDLARQFREQQIPVLILGSDADLTIAPPAEPMWVVHWWSQLGRQLEAFATMLEQAGDGQRNAYARNAWHGAAEKLREQTIAMLDAAVNDLGDPPVQDASDTPTE